MREESIALTVAASQFMKEKEYWFKKLSGRMEKTTFLYEQLPSPIESSLYSKDQVKYRFVYEVSKKLINLSNENDYALHIILLAGLMVLLHKYTGSTDILVGTPIYKQDNDDEGEFVNTILAIRTYIYSSATFKDVVLQAKQAVIEAEENQNYPIERLLNQLNLPLSRGSFPLFDIALLLKNVHDERYLHSIKINLIFSFIREDEGITGVFEYNPSLFKKNSIERIISHYTNLMDQVISYVNLPISDIDLLPREEKQQVLFDFNKTNADFPINKTIHDLFVEKVDKLPDNRAVICQDKELTYVELNRRSDQVSGFLVGKGVKEDTIVCIMVERSLEMIVGIMGILKAGGVYLPISVESPGKKKQFMFRDSNAALLLSTCSLSGEVEKLRSLEVESIFIEEIDNRQETLIARGEMDGIESLKDISWRFSSRIAACEPQPTTTAAYVIYTSGSTGEPKGVLVEHRSVVNRLHWMQRFYPLAPADVVLQKTPYVFDVSVWELFWWSFTGASLNFLAPGDERSPEAIIEAIEKQKITTLHFVPSMLTVFLDYLESNNERYRLASLKHVFSSGEVLGVTHAERFDSLVKRGSKVMLVNLYGPTEATVDVSYYNCISIEQRTKIPIGKPIDNIRFYIVDKHLQLQPKGVVGELCISGEGLARGYLNRAILTAEKFFITHFLEFNKNFQKTIKVPPSSVINLPDEVSKTPADQCLKPNDRWYRTGDLARWLPDGDVEFIGRIDNQVKIRGYRIEPAEIENQLLRIDYIKQCLVIDREKNGEKYLCGYVVSNKKVIYSEIRDKLLKNLPDYMIPSYIMKIERIPLTPNGKIDRNVLPEPKIESMEEYIAPRDMDEEKLVILWSALLGLEVERISIHSNFFELGGHSLKAAVLIARIHKEFNIKINLAEMFSNPTIAGLSALIKKSNKEEYSHIKSVEKREYYELSCAQKRFYILQQFDPVSTAYNINGVYVFDLKLARAELMPVFTQLVSRHESLRTSFVKIENSSYQKIQDTLKPGIEYYNIGEKGVTEIEGKSFIRAFDLAQAPLFRAVIVCLPDEKAVLLTDMHHIISDGTSIDILVREFIRLYNGDDLPQIKLQYKDFTTWQNDLLQTDIIKKQEEYWLQIFSGEIPSLKLPLDRIRPAVMDFKGNICNFELDEELTLALKYLCLIKNVTIFILLFAAYNVLLSRLSRQEDIIVGVPLAGRNHADLADVIGLFLNTAVFWSRPGVDQTFSSFLEEIKENFLNTFDNQDYQYEMLLEKLDLKRDSSRNPLFDTVFDFQNYNDDTPGNVSVVGKENHEGRVVNFDFRDITTKYDITIYLRDLGNKIAISCAFRTALFDRSTIKYIMGEYVRLVKLIVLSPYEKLKDYKIFSWKHLSDNSLVKHFEKRVEQYSDKIVVKSYTNALTYQFLNEKANRVAHKILQISGEKPILKENMSKKADDIVALLFEHEVDMVIGIISVLKTGNIYVPLDPAYPVDRLVFMLKDSRPGVLVTNTKNLSFAHELVSFTNNNIKVINIDSEEPHFSCRNLSTDLLPERFVYILYTSGSTGNPKGVLQDQLNIMTFIGDFIKNLQVNSSDRILLLTSFIHTVAAIDMFSALLSGGSLYIYDIKSAAGMDGLSRCIITEGITIYHSVPTVYRYWLESLPDHAVLSQVRLVVIGGEEITKNDIELYKKHFSEQCILVNLFGSSEVFIAASYYVDRKRLITRSLIPIGYPVENVDIYLLDGNDDEVGIFGEGEMVLKSEYLAPGYLNLPQQTDEAFNIDPLTGKGRVYRSGDLGRMLPDGSIDYLGRKDFQVEIRGNRIELSEIEAILDRNDKISKSIVSAFKNEKSESYLVAYCVTINSITITKEELRKYLRQKLPAYMIPVDFVFLDKFPLTLNGKIERKALLAPGIKTEIEYAPPRNTIEEKLVDIWADALELEKDKIGIYDNFFALGGHSFKVIKVVELANRENFAISFADMLRFQTIAELGDKIVSSSLSGQLPPLGDKLAPEKVRQFNSDFSPDNYPEFFPCILAIVREKLKYENHYEIDKGIFLTIDGAALMGLGYECDAAIEEKLNYMNYPFGQLVGFPHVDQALKYSIKNTIFSSFEEQMAFCIEQLKQNKIVILNGTTYFLNYSPDYLLDRNQWLKKMDELFPADYDPAGNRAHGKMFGHVFMLVDIAKDGYIIFDSTYNFFGKVHHEDLRRAVKGNSAIECSQGHPSYTAYQSYGIWELQMDRLDRFDNREMELQILKKTINIYLNKKKQRFNAFDKKYVLFLGLPAILELIRIMKIETKNRGNHWHLFRYVSYFVNSWNNKLLYLQIFLQDVSKNYTLPAKLLFDIDSAIKKWEFLNDNLRNVENHQKEFAQLFLSCQRQMNKMYNELAVFFKELKEAFDKMKAS